MVLLQLKLQIRLWSSIHSYVYLKFCVCAYTTSETYSDYSFSGHSEWLLRCQLSTWTAHCLPSFWGTHSSPIWLRMFILWTLSSHTSFGWQSEVCFSSQWYVKRFFCPQYKNLWTCTSFVSLLWRYFTFYHQILLRQQIWQHDIESQTQNRGRIYFHYLLLEFSSPWWNSLFCGKT